nr:molybdopterin molybdotransferase MoeA [Candidatus Sigynarchaeota archaeon]
MGSNTLKKTGFSSLVSMETARDGFLARVVPTGRVEKVPLPAALGRVLLSPINARVPVPSFDKSAMDGYAIIAKDSFGANVQKPRALDLIGSLAIGESSDMHMTAGQAMKIATGALIPAGADAVIKIEDTELDASGTEVKLYKQLAPGANIIRIGEDYKQGQHVLAAGHRLSPQDIGVLATLGYIRVDVHGRPLISVFATGNELVDLDPGRADPEGIVDPRQAGPCKMIDSNRYAIQAFIEQSGGTVINASILPDDENKIHESIAGALGSSDMVITTGGTSVGERDFIPSVIGHDHEILYHGIAMKPGAATLLGTGMGKPILGLSGFPVAAEIGMLYFGMPAIRKLAGAKVLDPRLRVQARIADAVAVKGFGITRLLRVALDYPGSPSKEMPRAIPVKMSGAGMQRSMVESDGFVEISPDIEGYEAGDLVIVTLHPR